MANQKPKKTTKKSTTKPETKKEATVVAPAVQTASANEPSLKGFFARKCDKNENVLTIFKSPRIWGALLGELVGTMFFMMLMLTLGVQPLYFVLAMVGVYVAIVGLSGANLNPLIFFCENESYFLYPFFCCRTSGLFPASNYHK